MKDISGTVALGGGEGLDLALTAFLCSDAANHLSGTVIIVRPPVYR